MVLFARNSGQIIFAVVVLAALPTVRCSILDSLPLVSQVKSLFQVMCGDAEGAKKTQENFVRTAPGISQITSAVQASQGDMEGARETQKQFLQNAEAVVDQIPVVGHIKGGFHYAFNDRKRGDEIMKAATSSTGALIGGVLGGPGGAIIGSGLVDAGISIVDRQPYGKIDSFVRILENDMDAGEWFDTGAGLAMEAVGGKTAKKALGKSAKRGGYIELDSLSSSGRRTPSNPSVGKPSVNRLRQRKTNQNLHMQAQELRQPLLLKSSRPRASLPLHLRMMHDLKTSLQTSKIKNFLKDGSAKARNKLANTLRRTKNSFNKLINKYGPFALVLGYHC